MERIEREVKHELERFAPGAGMAELVSTWPGVVGDAIARNAWPARLARDGTLHVATSSSAWAFELGQLSGDVLARLRDALGEGAPVRVRFAPGRLPAPAAEPPERGANPPRPSAEDRELARMLVDSLGDGELRSLAARAAAAALARRGSDR